MDTNKIKQRLVQDGYKTIREYTDAAGETFPDHDHASDERMIIVKGSITVGMDGRDLILRSGDELFVLAKAVHNAKVGPEGCEYIVGEK